MIVTFRPGSGERYGGWTSKEASIGAMQLPVNKVSAGLMPDEAKSGEAAAATYASMKKPTTAAERRRKWHTKTRNGCRTCKKRRVRCDETKPDCVRCISLNKVCEGYEPPQVCRPPPLGHNEWMLTKAPRYGYSSHAGTAPAAYRRGDSSGQNHHLRRAEPCSSSTRTPCQCS